MGSSLPLHLIKLCVGAQNVEDLIEWQKKRHRQGAGERPYHITRMWPRRDQELLSSGGSLYWVIKGSIRARQKILDFQEVRGEDGIRRCAIIFEPMVRRTIFQPRRAFQGWRYFKAAEAPADLAIGSAQESALPAELASKLDEVGVR